LQCYFFKNDVIAEKNVIDYLYNLCFGTQQVAQLRYCGTKYVFCIFCAFFMYHI